MDIRLYALLTLLTTLAFNNIFHLQKIHQNSHSFFTDISIDIIFITILMLFIYIFYAYVFIYKKKSEKL